MKQEFECAYHDDNAAACEGFLTKARAFRVELPPTVDALTQQCNSLVQVKTTEVAEVKAIAEVETSAEVKSSAEVEVKTAANATDLPWQCTTGIVNRIRNQGPECFNRCPNLCGPVAVAVKRFFRGGSTAVKKSICSMKQEFECAYHDDNAAACEGFLTKARAFRVELPPTVDALTQQCNQLR